MFRHDLDNAAAGSSSNDQPNPGQACLNDRGTPLQNSCKSAMIKKRLMSDDDDSKSHHKRLMADRLPKQGSCNDEFNQSTFQAYKRTLGSQDKLEDSSGNRGQKDSCDDSQAKSHSKHLVRTLSDLPKFITIEGFRVASYMTDGEPYLCLPHLLQYVQRKYPLDKVIDIFEKTVTNFGTATPKQIEGFVKAIVLPPGASDCPLIRRSDAERVCLTLYDQFAHDTIDDDSEREKLELMHANKYQMKSAQSKGQDSSAPIDHTNLINATEKRKEHHRNEQDSAQSTDQDRRDSFNARTHLAPGSQIKPNSEHTRPPVERVSMSPNDEKVSHDSDNKSTETNNDTESIFESKHQDIIDFARAATSTLRIKLYHRCFGKCNGIYYPTKLVHSNPRCIECSECHRLFSPRRFIGHTHRTKENNVCHWGFNSYLWRHYIYLCKNQDINQLDDEELLVQMNTLKSVPDEESCETENVSESAEDLEVPKGLSANIAKLDRLSHSVSSIEGACETAHTNFMTTSRLNQQRHPHQTGYSTEAVKSSVCQQPSSRSVMSVQGSDNLANKQRSRSLQDTFTRPMNQSALSWSMADISSSKMMKEYDTQMPSASSNSIQLPWNNLTQNPTFYSERCRSLSTVQYRNFNYPSFSQFRFIGSDVMRDTQLHMPHTSLHMHPGYHRLPEEISFDLMIKRDMFISSSMAAYLSGRCLHSDLIRDIVEQLRDIVSKSRMIF